MRELKWNTRQTPTHRQSINKAEYILQSINIKPSTFNEVRVLNHHGYTCRSTLAHYPDSEPISLCSYSLKLRSGELEKHQIPILLSLVWPYRNPNLWSTVLEASTINVTMTTPMRFWEKNKTITTQFTGSLRFSQFSDCWLILSVYILEFWLSFWKIVRSSVILLLPFLTIKYVIVETFDWLIWFMVTCVS